MFGYEPKERSCWITDDKPTSRYLSWRSNFDAGATHCQCHAHHLSSDGRSSRQNNM